MVVGRGIGNVRVRKKGEKTQTRAKRRQVVI